MTALEGAALVVLAAWAAIDRTAFGQTLLAHPLIAAGLAGALLGDPAAGVLTGLVLTALSAPVVPVGERVLRDWTSVAVALGALVALTADPVERGLVLLLAVAAARPAGRLIDGVRARAAVAARRRRERPAVRRLDGLESEHLRLAALHLVRGPLTVALLVGIGGWILPHVAQTLGTPERAALGLVWEVAPLAALPLLLRFHAGFPGAGRWIAVGVVLGALILALSPATSLDRVLGVLS